MDEYKCCSKCKKTKTLHEFYRDKTKSCGYEYCCKMCKYDKKKETRKDYAKKHSDISILNKTCSICRIELPIERFTRDKCTKSGFASFCKDCRRKVDDRRKIEKLMNPIVTDLSCKECHKCCTLKPMSMFPKTRKSNDGHSYICIDCTPKSQHTREKQLQYERKYREKNKDKYSEKYKSIQCRVRSCLRSRILSALHAQDVCKKESTIKYLNCTMPFFKKWIEFQFKENMAWENYGTWHLDHVRPCASFDFTKQDDVDECFNWSNYQPLEKHANIKKGDKVDKNIIEQHKIKVQQFIEHLSSAENKEGELRETPNVASTNHSK